MKAGFSIIYYKLIISLSRLHRRRRAREATEVDNRIFPALPHAAKAGKSLRALFRIAAAILVIGTANIAAAEFNLDAGRVVLRRLQYCQDCGSALLVTHLHAGTPLRCPDCGREQTRLSGEYLLTQLYQLCRLCLVPLDPKGHHPGETVACDNCHTPQILSREAFPPSETPAGLGYAPGFPPGSGKKKLLYSPERPDGPITPVPLDDTASADLPPPPGTTAAHIPRPPPAPAAPGLSAIPVDNTEPASAPPPPTIGGADIPTADGVAARVNGLPILTAEIDRIMTPLLARLREAAGPTGDAEVTREEPSLRREVLSRLIDRELAFREAEAIGHKFDAAALRQREAALAAAHPEGGFDLRREALRDAAMADMRRRFAEKPLAASPETVRDYYRRHPEHFQRPRLLALASLVVYQDRMARRDRRGHREIAAEISRQLEQGRAFDDLRARYDEFAPGVVLPEAGLQPENTYAAQVLAAAGDLRSGAVFGPVFLEGMALFGKVVDARPAGPAPFEEVEKEIRQRLESEATEKNLDAWLKRLRQRAKIETYTSGD